jgi:hypothetical protein
VKAAFGVLLAIVVVLLGVRAVIAQCTSFPGAGPHGTTCGHISTGEQLCKPGN